MITIAISDSVLRRAIELRISEVFPAMNAANALAGSGYDQAWEIVRKHRLPELVADALDRGLPVREFHAAVTSTPFLDTSAYLKVREEIGGRADFPR